VAIGEYFPAALEAFDDLDAVDAPELLGKAPDPTSMPSSCWAGARPGLGGATDTRSDHRGATERPPPRHRAQDRSDPGSPAR